MRVKIKRELSKQIPSLKGKLGTVVGFVKNKPGCLLVRLDGKKRAESFSVHYLTPIL